MDCIKSENENATSANNISVQNLLPVKLYVEQIRSENGLQEESRYFCKICDIGFLAFSSLKEHFSSSHTVKITRKLYFCQTCEENFTTLMCFQSHLHREHSVQKIDACVKCNFQLPHEKLVPTRHSGDTSLEHCCILCQAEAKAKQIKKAEATKMRKKVPSHKDVSQNADHEIRGRKKTLTCEVCQACYAESHNLTNHLLTKHGVRRKDTPHHCEVCQKGFKHLGALKIHRQRQHIETKPHVCGVCNMKFSFEGQLQKHSMRLHAKVRCEVCLQEFSKSYIRIHMRIHLGIEPHACIVCDKRFKTSGSLKIHFQSHTGEKPYVCETCGRAFTRSKHLKTHMRLHTGEKPYVCDICQRGFTQKWVMYTHRRIHTGERPFECEVCGKGFIYKSQMKTHQQNCKDSPPNEVG